jgi:integrase
LPRRDNNHYDWIPKWGNTKFLEIRRLHVNDLLDHIVDNHGRSQADAVLAVIRGICNWYATRSEHYESPIVAKMKRDRRKPEDRARSRFLNDNEIRLVWDAANECGQFGALVQVALLTGQRRGRFGEKSTAMRWSEIAKNGLWTFSHEERRKGVANQIKLSPMAMEIIRKRSKIDGNPFVFPGCAKGPFNHFSQGMDQLREKLPDLPHWTIHDLRRTARKLMSRAGVRPDIGELVLGHSIKGIRAVYDDVTEYQSLIDQAVQAIANVVDQIVNGTGDNVVQMRARQ